MHAIPQIDYPLRSFGMSSSLGQIQEELQARATESLEARGKKLQESAPGIKVRVLVMDGEPHDATLECAKKESADMIIMGTHGHTGITHALLGSSAEKVVRLAECPVLTVRAPAE